MTRLAIWANPPLPAVAERALRDGATTHALTWKPNHTTPDPDLRAADVAFGQPPVADVLAGKRLRFIQLTSAGYTAYDRDDVRAALAARGAVLAKASRVYDEPCAEQVLAFMLANARSLAHALDLQRGSRVWTTKPLRESSRLLVGQTVVLYGYGSIALRLAQLLAPFDAKVIGVRRRPRGDEPISVLATDDPATLEWLGRADHVVDLLPASPSTGRMFDRDLFARIRPGAIFYNIGRGTTVDQDALREVLLSGRLAAAWLDVTDPEPLPLDHPLWTTARCFITPHMGGGHGNEEERLVAHFLANLARFESGQPIDDRVW